MCVAWYGGCVFWCLCLLINWDGKQTVLTAADVILDQTFDQVFDHYRGEHH